MNVARSINECRATLLPAMPPGACMKGATARGRTTVSPGEQLFFPGAVLLPSTKLAVIGLSDGRLHRSHSHLTRYAAVPNGVYRLPCTANNTAGKGHRRKTGSPLDTSDNSLNSDPTQNSATGQRTQFQVNPISPGLSAGGIRLPVANGRHITSLISNALAATTPEYNPGNRLINTTR